MVRAWRRRQPRIGVVLGVVVVLSALGIASAQAQVQSSHWSQPYLLSSNAGKASEGYLVADQFGFVHCFWTETLFADQRSIIEYARFDGAAWSSPIELSVSGHDINNVSPVVDKQGTLHLAWSEGLNGPAYYTQAPASYGLSAPNWAQPVRIDVPARALHLRKDSQGVLHLVYVNQLEAPGVYYVRSADQGQTWTEPAWLDLDILPDHIPDSLSFELDDTDGLHVVWFYGALEQSGRADWVRYSRSLNGGHSWSNPYTIDRYIPGSTHHLTAASPVMIVQNQTVHVIWAAGDQPYRFHRFSSDAGQTWSEPRRIFGQLHGQAFDGFAIDRAGRVHYVAQIRYPQAIYHAYWERGQWSAPELVYLIAQEESDEGIGDRIHAHFTLPVVRAGNQLILTFTDPPADENRRLFAMDRILDDIAPLETVPTPAPAATLTAMPSPSPMRPTGMPTWTATAPVAETVIAQPVADVSTPEATLRLALVPTLLLLGVTLALRMWFRHRQ
jgi:hypothetical protein